MNLYYFLDVYGKSLNELFQSSEMVMLMKQTPSLMTKFDRPTYVCPICCTHFVCSENGEFFPNQDFSLDHFPPKSVGGIQTVLVCRPCNSTFGGDVEYTVQEYLKFILFINKRENSTYSTKAEFAGVPGNYRISSRWENGKLTQYLPFKNYPLVKEWLFNPQEEMSFKIKILQPPSKLIQKAMLKAAYLWCFSRWGYDFAYSKTGIRLRKILVDNQEHPLVNLGVFRALESCEFEGIYYFKKPALFQCFAVFMDIKLEEPSITQKIFVIIPRCQEGSWEHLHHITSFLGHGQTTFTLISCNKEYIKQGDFWAYSRLSNQMLNNSSVL